jgi:hypothetical protein
MTPERTRLLAENQALYDQIAAAKARRAEVQAELAKLDAEPDWEAWRPALDAYFAEQGYGEYASTPLDADDIRLVRALIAAAPLIPRDAGMTDAEIEAMTEGEPPYTASRIKWAIRETLKRALATQENAGD